MGHKSVVSGHQKSTGIPRVNGLSTGPPNLWCHNHNIYNSFVIQTIPNLRAT